MEIQANLIASASVKSNPERFDRDAAGISWEWFIVGEDQFYFSRTLRFNKNGNDFWVVIESFWFDHIRSTSMPDGTTQRRLENVRLRLTPGIANPVELRLVEYYSNEISRNAFPFGAANCKFLGVLFADSVFK